MKAKNEFNLGDAVSVINDTMTGHIVKIDMNSISVECTDGFIYNYHPKELVLRKDWKTLIRHPENKDFKPNTRKEKSSYVSKKGSVVKEIDLHIHELVESEIGMSNFQKLSLQLDTAQRELQKAIAKKQQKIIFIHGRGEGVLRTELRNLVSKYPATFQDASYQEYGQGATEVIIFQNKK